ncbi:MAG: eamA-like transporter family protein [Herbaspirillum sp.]|jgi:drug/metabolite transporter (DMT)-like permease|nr:eamA-like transporter family protein [Herbaspirillum sp.]
MTTASHPNGDRRPAQHEHPLKKNLLAVAPAVFVVIWSTGFIVAKFGLPYAPPLTFLILRFLGVLAILGPLALLFRIAWPVGRIGHIAVAGILIHAGYLGGVWCGIKLGMPAGLAALIVGLQPILTAFAAPFVGESVQRRQWIGLMLGLCGVGLVVASKISLTGLSWQSIACSFVALLSITVGSLYQKRFCPSFDLRTGVIVQYIASAIVLLPLAIRYEHLDLALSSVQWTPNFVGALLWSVAALSIGAIFLLFLLLRQGAATSVSSLMYMTPPATALMAWLMFGEAFSIMGALGMVVAVVAVAFVVRNKKA